MRNTLYFILFVFFGLMLLTACESTDPEKPTVRFEKPFDQRRVSLKRILHERFQFEGDSNIYKVDFERRNKMNHLIQVNTGDTVLRGYVSNNDDLWVVSEPLDSMGFLIWGFRTEDDLVYAWDSKFEQHKALSSAYTSEGVLDIESGVLMIPTKEEQILASLRKELLPIYKAGIRFERLSRADVREALESDFDADSDEALDEEQEMGVQDAHTQVQSAIVNVYPQPAKTELKLAMATSGDYLLKCFDMNGAPFQDYEKSGSTLTLDVSEWDNGTYILAVFNADGMLLDQKKVVVGR